MDFQEVKEAVENKSALVVDVRGPEEVSNAGKIPGSVNVPLPDLGEAMNLGEDEFSSRFGIPKPQKGDKIVCHCMKGARAAKAAEALTNLGYTSAVAYPGSFEDWKAKGGPIEMPKK